MEDLASENPLRITAVIPAYNNGRYIKRSIDSVLSQTRPVDEIVVVDDGSTDDTAEVVSRYGDKVRYIRQDNAGASAARNTGIQAATGDWIAFLDGDDEWLPDKIKLQTERVGRNPDLMWTSGNYIDCLCDENRRAEHILKQKCLAHLGGKEYFDSYFDAIQLYQWGHTDCMLIRKDVFEEVGGFRVGQLKANDIDMWLRIAYRYPAIGFSCEALAIYHLSIADSIVKKYRRAAVYTDFIKRHLAIATEAGVLVQFRPAAGFMMRRWIRGLLFGGRKTEIRQMLQQFPECFSIGYRMLIYSLTVWPPLTAFALRLLSKIVRTLKLRRRVVAPPAQ